MSMRAPTPSRVDFVCWTTEKLRNADTDQFHHVNNAVMASFFEGGRMAVFSGQDMQALKGNANLAVVRLVMNFHKELFYPGDVSIGTRLTSVGERSLVLEQGLFKDESCIASAQAVCVLIDQVSGRAVTLSDALRKCLLGSSV
jgi:acyl-CoA thioester hydrolase